MTAQPNKTKRRGTRFNKDASFLLTYRFGASRDEKWLERALTAMSIMRRFQGKRSKDEIAKMLNMTPWNFGVLFTELRKMAEAKLEPEEYVAQGRPFAQGKKVLAEPRKKKT